jgi:hypothetical protein
MLCRLRCVRQTSGQNWSDDLVLSGQNPSGKARITSNKNASFVPESRGHGQGAGRSAVAGSLGKGKDSCAHEVTRTQVVGAMMVVMWDPVLVDTIIAVELNCESTRYVCMCVCEFVMFGSGAACVCVCVCVCLYVYVCMYM